MRRGAALLALAGCAAAPAPALRHAGLFEAGRELVYEAELRRDGGPPSRQRIHCRIERAEQRDDTRLTEVRCDQRLRVVEGAWGIDGKGRLWRLESWPVPPQILTNVGWVWLDARPVEAVVVEEAHDEETEETVFREGDAWCVREANSGPGEWTYQTLCHDDDGIVRGEDRHVVRGGAETSVRFRRLDDRRRVGHD